jgi:hypothetical protein
MALRVTYGSAPVIYGELLGHQQISIIVCTGFGVRAEYLPGLWFCYGLR